MAKIEIYTTDYCPYCTRAKQLLDFKDVDYTEIDVTHDEKLRADLVNKAEGRRTVPQIFINDRPVGGYDDLKALEDRGELDQLLTA